MPQPHECNWLEAVCRGVGSTVPCNSKNTESCSVGVGTTEQGLICILVFPQGLSVTPVTEGVEALCCQRPPQVTGAGRRAARVDT